MDRAIKRLGSALLVALAGPVAVAQDEPAPRASSALREQIDARIKEMREAIREGLPIITNVKVTVKLRNAHKIKGVVKQGRFVESPKGLDFVQADTTTPGAGLRIWYYNNTNSYVFLPFEAIESYRIGVRLTDVEVKEIEDRIESERQRAEAARGDYLTRKAAEQVAEEVAKAAAGAGAAAAETEAQRREREAEEARLLALLAEFPPESGWGEARLHEIQMRKITVGAYPDEHSRRFLELFPDWQRALKLREVREAAAAAAAAAAATPGLPAKPGVAPPGGAGPTPSGAAPGAPTGLTPWSGVPTGRSGPGGSEPLGHGAPPGPPSEPSVPGQPTEPEPRAGSEPWGGEPERGGPPGGTEPPPVSTEPVGGDPVEPGGGEPVGGGPR